MRYIYDMRISASGVLPAAHVVLSAVVALHSMVYHAFMVRCVLRSCYGVQCVVCGVVLCGRVTAFYIYSIKARALQVSMYGAFSGVKSSLFVYNANFSLILCGFAFNTVVLRKAYPRGTLRARPGRG